MAVVEAGLNCPRCGLATLTGLYGPCLDCREILNRIYRDRNTVRRASLAHMEQDRFNAWLREPCEALDGVSPWSMIDAGFTDEVLAAVRAMKLTFTPEH